MYTRYKHIDIPEQYQGKTDFYMLEPALIFIITKIKMSGLSAFKANVIILAKSLQYCILKDIINTFKRFF